MSSFCRYFRISLAVADFLTGIVVCSAINSTYTLFFIAHPFQEQGEPITLASYFDQAYIDGFGIISVLSLSASILMLLVISADRYYKLSNKQAAIIVVTFSFTKKLPWSEDSEKIFAVFKSTAK